MKYLVSSVRSVIRRPVLLWLVAALIFPVVFISNKYSLLKYISGEQGIGSLKVFDTYLLLLQLAVKHLSTFRNILLIFLSLIVFSLIAGLLSGGLLSGYFYIMHKAVNQYKPKKNDFFAGIKKNFFSIFKVTSVSTVITGIIIALFSFIFVPSVVTLNALLAGKAELFFILVLFSVVTVFVLFFSFTFYRIYVLYWFPAAISFKNKSFRAGRYVANNNFWRSMISVILFDIIFIISRVVYFTSFFRIYSQESVSRAAENRLLISDWLFMTFFIYLFVYYIFYSFKHSKDQIV